MSPRRPSHQTADAVRLRHDDALAGVQALLGAFAKLYPEIPEIRTAETCLVIARRHFRADYDKSEYSQLSSSNDGRRQ